MQTAVADGGIEKWEEKKEKEDEGQIEGHDEGINERRKGEKGERTG